MSASLFERLGGEEKIRAIVNDAVDLHLENPLVKTRFMDSDVPKAKRMAGDFFIVGSGGPGSYAGKDMKAAHRGMNISEQEFLAVVDDIMAALDKHRVPVPEKNEVLGILYSLKGEIIRG